MYLLLDTGAACAHDPGPLCAQRFASRRLPAQKPQPHRNSLVMSSPMLLLRGPRMRAALGRRPRWCCRQASSRAELERLARQLYEDVWSTGNVALLDIIMAEDHVQCDQLWQPEKTDGGRERMQKGIAGYRRFAPGLTFTVQRVAVDEAAQMVTVEWTNESEEPAAGSARGASVLSVRDGQIAESRVYRSQSAGEEASRLKRQAEAQNAAE